MKKKKNVPIVNNIITVVVAVDELLGIFIFLSYIYIYIYTYIHTYIYIYIDIEREREREGSSSVPTCVYVRVFSVRALAPAQKKWNSKILFL